jgi:hypothetical protein
LAVHFVFPWVLGFLVAGQRRRTMSFLSVVPEFVTAAAGDLEGIGSALNAANVAAAAATTGVAAPGADAVSAAVAAVFGTHGHQYQTLSAQVSAFHARFVSTLSAGVNQYLGTEVANAEQNFLNALNVPATALFGHSSATAGAAADSGALVSGGGGGGTAASTGGAVTVTSGGGGGGVATLPGGEGGVVAPVTPVAPPVVAPPVEPPPAGTAFTSTVFSQQTPLGEVSLSLSGTVSSSGQVTLTGGSVAVPQSLLLAVDALGAPYNAYVALGSNGPALLNAVQTGNYGGALGILAHAPGDVWHSFLYGQQTLTVSQSAASGSGFSELGVNVPMNGLLVDAPGSVSLSATPTGGGPAQLVTVSGAQFNGLIPALQQLGGGVPTALPASMQAVAVQAVNALPGLTFNVDGSGNGTFGGTIFDQQTPFGEVSLSLSGTVAAGVPTLTAASAVVPQPVMLAVDALGAPYNAYVALGPNGPALLNAVQTGNYGGALGILAHAPSDVWHEFLYGQQTLTVSTAGDGTAYSQLGASAPMNGLLVDAPGSLTISATPTGGGPAQVVTVSGAQFNGLIPALRQLGGGVPTALPASMQAVAVQAVNALPGLTFNVDGSGNGTFGGTIFDQQTPFGEVSLSLSGTVAAGVPTLTAASAVVPQPVMLAVDALGAPYNAYVALGPNGPALLNAVQTGNYGGALGILAHAPSDVWHEFLYGQQTLTVSTAGDGTAYSQLGASAPMNGLLVDAPGSLTISATPTGGGPAQLVTVSGAQFNGLIPALQQLTGGQLPAPMQAVGGQVTALLGLGDFSMSVVDQSTPFGQVQLTLTGTVSGLPPHPVLTGGSLVMPQSLVLAENAFGAPYNAFVALGSTGPAFVGALQTGNVGGALTILAHSPGDVWHSFLYGQQTLTVSQQAPSGSGFSQFNATVPLYGLLVDDPSGLTLTAMATDGSLSMAELTGAQFNGLFASLQDAGLLPV